MSSKRFALIALAAAVAPGQALAHTELLAGRDPVAAVFHFVSQPDHAMALVAVAAGALFLSPRLRAAVRMMIDRLHRR